MEKRILMKPTATTASLGGGVTGTLVLLWALLLTGCAHTLTAKVTRFNQWPADAAGASYRFTTPDPQRDLDGHGVHQPVWRGTGA